MPVPSQREARPDRLFVPEKDANYEYRWLNCQAGPQGDQNMYMAQWEGWEVVEVDPKLLPTHMLSQMQTGQSTSNSAASTTMRRGDLVLYRMPKARFKELERQVQENKERQSSTLDTMVFGANENARRVLRDRGQTRIPGTLVFREDVGDPQD